MEKGSPNDEHGLGAQTSLLKYFQQDTPQYRAGLPVPPALHQNIGSVIAGTVTVHCRVSSPRGTISPKHVLNTESSRK